MSTAVITVASVADCKPARDVYKRQHYTRLEERNGKVYIIAGDDDKKDQSYFLWRLGQELLKRCIFPLGTRCV